MGLPPLAAFSGFFPLPVPWSSATLLADAPGDRLQMEGSGCVFCFVGGCL